MPAEIIVSISIVSVLIVIVFACGLCWERRVKSQQIYYVLNENEGLKKSSAENATSDNYEIYSIFRRLSLRFGLGSYCNNAKSTLQIAASPSVTELCDSTEKKEEFDDAVLQIENLENTPKNRPDDDSISCASAESRNTFHSVHTNRRHSAMSCAEYFDVNDI